MKRYTTAIISGALDTADIRKKVEAWVDTNGVENVSMVHLEYSNTILLGGYINIKETKKKK